MSCNSKILHLAQWSIAFLKENLESIEPYLMIIIIRGTKNQCIFEIMRVLVLQPLAGDKAEGRPISFFQQTKKRR